MAVRICLPVCMKTVRRYRNCIKLARCLQFHPLSHTQVLHSSMKSQPPGEKKSGTSSTSSSDSSSSDEEDNKGTSSKILKNQAPNESAQKNTEAIEKLNLLLQSMVKINPEKAKPAQISIKTVTAKPRKRMTDPEISTAKQQKENSISAEVLTATKAVAESIGADSEKTESELLKKLRTHSGDITTVSEVDPSKKAVASSTRLSELFVGMKIDRSKAGDVSDGEPEGRAYQVRRILSRQKMEGTRERTPDSQQSHMHLGDKLQSQIGYAPSKRIDLFGGEPLGIFVQQKIETQAPDSEVPVLRTWKEVYSRELRLAVTHPPTNIWEEMIMWTEQGKLWKFPINNEQGLEEEANVGFHEHVFLEQHLDLWCPKRGPIRHFMEIVCVGLSKNAYISAAKKREHLEWYRDYFEEKKDILKDVGALPDQ